MKSWNLRTFLIKKIQVQKKITRKREFLSDLKKSKFLVSCKKQINFRDLKKNILTNLDKSIKI